MDSFCSAFAAGVEWRTISSKSSEVFSGAWRRLGYVELCSDRAQKVSQVGSVFEVPERPPTTSLDFVDQPGRDWALFLPLATCFFGCDSKFSNFRV